MKLIQANIWNGALKHTLCPFLREQDADVLVLQEVSSSPHGKSRFFDALQNVQAATGLPHVFFTRGWSSQSLGKQVDFGLAVLSRTPILSSYEEFTHGRYEPHYDPDLHDYNIRFFQHVTLHDARGEAWHIVNYHGYHDPQSKVGGSLAAAHCARIAAYASELNGRLVIAGDFNVLPDSPALIPLDALATNLVKTHQVATTRNVLSRSEGVVDYIWVANGVQVERFEVASALISDHAALVLEAS